MRASLPFTAEKFGRAIMMPNLVPLMRTTADAAAYRDRLMAAQPPGNQFQPRMTCCFTDDTHPDNVERGFQEKVFTGVRLYPANATTNAAAGVTDFEKVRPVPERMLRIGTTLLIQTERVDPTVDVFDREVMLIERTFERWTREFWEFAFAHAGPGPRSSRGRGHICCRTHGHVARGDMFQHDIQRRQPMDE